MSSFEELIAQGDPVDPDLVSLLAAEGVDSPAAAHALGQEHWIAFFAQQDGFDRDLLGMLTNFEVSWEEAPNLEAMQRPIDDFELGVPVWAVAQKLGAETLADVYRLPREQVRRALAERSGMLGELTDAMARQGLSW